LLYLERPQNVSNDEEYSFDYCFSIAGVVEGRTGCCTGGGIFSFRFVVELIRAV